jgi:hypothetical protein
LGGDNPGGFTVRTAIASIVGGTASKIGGGKFSNGAVSGAFVHMFNAEVKKIVNEFRRSPVWKYMGKVDVNSKITVIAKALRVEMKVLMHSGINVYNVVINKSWNTPSISTGEPIVINFSGGNGSTHIYEIQMENQIETNWHVKMPLGSDTTATSRTTGDIYRYADVYAQ